MKAIISTTYSDKYLWFLPLTTWLWNKLGVDVICFFPYLTSNSEHNKRIDLLIKTEREVGLKINMYQFNAPEEKQATYAQCSRLYGACLDLPDNERLITGDIDMGVFKIPNAGGTGMGVYGIDLVPVGQIPICYIYGDVYDWRKAFNLKGKTYQECLDDLLGHIEVENFRGNYWSKDQEEAYNKILGSPEKHATLYPKAREGTTFAANRLDRDDAYLLERLDDNIIDFHFPRPAYEEKNFEIIMTVLRHYFPLEDFSWLINYNHAYKKLL